MLVNAGSPPHLLGPADVLLLHPFNSETYYEQLFKHVHPRLVIPNHWDDLWQPISRSPQPSFQPPRFGFPPVQRINLLNFQRILQRLDPAVRVFLPDRLKEYDLQAQLAVSP